MGTQLLIVLLALVGVGTLAGQDHRATLVAIGPMPRYADMARNWGLTEPIVLHAVVGEKGSVDTIWSAGATGIHALAARNAITAVREWRFAPTMRAGRPVIDTILLTITNARGIPVPPLTDDWELWELRATSDSSWLIRLGPPQPATVEYRPDSALRDTVARVAVAQLLTDFVAGHPKSALTTCLRLRTGPSQEALTAEDFALLVRPDMVVDPPVRCPPTIFGMAYVEGQDRIQGVDPVKVTVGDVWAWREDLWRVEIATTRSASGAEVRCAVRRNGDGFTAICRSVSRWVS
jgi:hypothetical protein